MFSIHFARFTALAICLGLVVAARPALAQPAAAAPPTYVMFVLDCSASTALKDLPGGKQRFDVMRTELGAVIEELSAGHRFGLTAYGHRAGFDKSGAVKFRGEQVEGLLPATDAEVLVPFTEHGEGLEKLAPWGQSPVYLSLKEALNGFGNVPPEAKRRIVLLTDSVNSQIGGVAEPTTALNLDEMLSGPPYDKTRLDIIGVKLPTEAALAEGTVPPANSVAELRRLAARTKGTLANVEDVSGLRSQLRRLFGLEVKEPAKLAIASTEPGTITGTVKYRSKPAAGIKVTLKGTGRSVKSDAEGKFEFKDVKPPKATLEADGSIKNVTRTGTLADVVPVPKGGKANDVVIELE